MADPAEPGSSEPPSPDHDPPPIQGAALSLTDAAQACRVSRITLKRALAAERFPNAYRTAGPAGAGTGPWLIPVVDLLAAGYHPNAPDSPDPGSEEQVSEEADLPPVPLTWEEYARLRERLARGEEQADERGRHIATLTRALEEVLRKVPELPPAPKPESPTTVGAPPSAIQEGRAIAAGVRQEEEPAMRRGWFRRMFGVPE